MILLGERLARLVQLLLVYHSPGPENIGIVVKSVRVIIEVLVQVLLLVVVLRNIRLNLKIYSETFGTTSCQLQVASDILLKRCQLEHHRNDLQHNVDM